MAPRRVAPYSRSPDQFAGETASLQPVASPVDTFVRPGPSPLRGLAEALGILDSSLSAYTSKKAAETDANDRLRGEAAFWRGNKEGDAEAVRQGFLPAQRSKAFMEGYKGASGIQQGNTLLSEFDDAYLKWDGKERGDPAELQAFVHSFVKERVGTDDPEVLKTLLPHVRTLADRAFALQTEYSHNKTYTGSLTANIAILNQVADADWEDDPNNVAQAFADRREAFVSSGGRPEDYDKAAMDLIAGRIADGQRGLLTVFDQKVPGTEHSYKDTPYGAALLSTATERLEATERSALEQQHKVATEMDKKAKEDAERGVVEFMAANPGVAVPENLVKEYARWEPTARVKVAGWRKDLASGFTDPQKKMAVYNEILGGGGVKSVMEAATHGVFGTTEDLAAAYNFAKGMKDNASRIEEVLGGPTAKGIFGAIDVRTKGKTTTGEPLAGLSDAGLAAQYDFRRLATEWVIKNPGASVLETEKALSGIGKLILDSITVPDIMEAGTYRRPSELGGADNPYAPKPEPNRQQAPATPMASPKPAPQEAPGVRSFLDEMSPEQRSLIEQDAAKAGVSPEDYASRMLDEADKGIDAPAPEEPGPAPKASTPQSKPGSADIIWNMPQEALKEALQEAERRGITIDDYLMRNPPEKVNYSPRAYVPGSGGNRTIWPAAEMADPSELVVSRARGYDPDVKNLQPALVKGVVALQAEFGKSLPVVSGHRGVGRNQAAGGAKHSQHLHGNAVDIDVRGFSTEERNDLIRLASARGFGGIGVYANSIHLDYGGRRAWGPDFHAGSVPGWAKGAISEHVSGKATAPQRVAGGSAPPRGAITPPPSVYSKGFAEETALSFLKEASSENPLDTEFPGSANIAGDPVATRLANLVKQHEGAGNYNAVYGNANSTADLSKLTLDSVVARQAAAVKAGKNSPVGGYQIKFSTLRGLKKELGLSGSEKFTPELQDRLFEALLYRRGYEDWRAGKLSDRTFALRLSQEWASLPNPDTGMSYYAGDGTHGSTKASREDVYRALGLML